MKKKLFTREVRVGIMAVIAIFVLYFGMNFLKGVDIFSSSSYYYASYENLGGLVKSCPVYIKGLKVGQVEEIKYDFSKKESFLVRVSVSKDIQLPKGAVIELYDDGLMGGKAIRIVYEPTNSNQAMYAAGDTIPSTTGIGLMAQLSGSLAPKIESIATQTDSLVRSVRKLVDNKSIGQSLSSIETTTHNLAQSSDQLKKMMTDQMPRILGDVNVVTADFKQISGNLKKVDYASTMANIDHTVNNLKLFSDKLNSKEGSLGLLLNDKNLYLNLSSTAADADKLLVDLQKNPKRYVHFSLFGKKSN